MLLLELLWPYKIDIGGQRHPDIRVGVPSQGGKVLSHGQESGIVFAMQCLRQ